MKTTTLGTWRGRLGGLLVASALALAGCGDDGSTGPAGPTGPQGPAANSEIPSTLDASITNASVAEDGTLNVDFQLLDGLGNGFVGLEASDIRFTVAQLKPLGAEGEGEASQWQSYINREESAPDPAAGIGSGTEDKIQATAEGATAGTLVDHRDGTYTYTFDTNLKNVSDPVAVSFDPELTHRIAIQMGRGFPPTNPIFDWRPSDGATTSIDNRKIVAIETCNGCHGQLAFHGGGRVDTDYCVTCHNPGSADANSGRTVDFKVMIHKIHRGANLPSVEAGGEYAIWGFRDSKHDYTNLQLPQDIRNCQSCHVEGDSALPQAANWRTVPTAEACSSCHDDVNFETGDNHPAGPRTNDSCAGCHGENGFAKVDDNHTGVMSTKESLRSAVVVTPESISIDQATGDVSVDVTFMLDGSPVDRLRLAADPDADTEAGAKLPRQGFGPDNGALAINWDDGSGFQINHQEVNFNDCSPAADGSGRFTCNASGLLAGISDSDQVTVSSVDLFACFNEDNGEIVRCDSTGINVGTVEIEPVIATFNGDGTTSSDAYDRIGADLASCQSCHADSKFHHGATDLVQCKTCHNATRVGFRGLGDLKRHVHRFHDDEDNHYPNNIDNCAACHAEGQFDLPVQENDRPSIASNGAGGNVFVSATAVACGSCHIETSLGHITASGTVEPASGSDLTDGDAAIVDHMIQNGAVFGAATRDAATKVESCAVCHGVGSEFGVESVHTLR